MKVGDLVKHIFFPNCVGLLVDFEQGRYRVRWLVKHPRLPSHDTWTVSTQIAPLGAK